MTLSKNLFFFFSAIGLAVASQCALADSATNTPGGVGLSATRLVYHIGSDEEHLGVINSSTNNAFLIQSWITDVAGTKTKDFFITPPLFVLKPGKEGTLRVSWAHNNKLPLDRESLYYLSSKAIPSVDPALNKNKAVLLVATQSKIKMLIRPDGLTVKPTEAPAMIRCSNTNGHLKLNNTSPYYVTLVNIKTSSGTTKSEMVAPLSTLDTDIKLQGNSVKFQTVNDYGANTPEQSCTF